MTAPFVVLLICMEVWAHFGCCNFFKNACCPQFAAATVLWLARAGLLVNMHVLAEHTAVHHVQKQLGHDSVP